MTLVASAVSLGIGSSAHAGTLFSHQVILSPHDRGAYGDAIEIVGNTIIVTDGQFHCDAQFNCDTGAHVYQKLNGIWTDVAELSFPQINRGAIYAAISPAEDLIALSDEKKIYVYQKPATGWSNIAPTAILAPPAVDAFHDTPLGLYTDGNSIFVNMCNASSGTFDCNGVEVFNKPASGWMDSSTPDVTIQNIGAQSSLIGSSGVLAFSSSSASTFVYPKPVGGWTDTSVTYGAGGSATTITPPASFTSNDSNHFGFGFGLAFSANTLAVTGAGTTSPGASALSPGIFLYDGSASNWASPTLAATLMTSDNDLGGTLLAASPNVIALASGPNDPFAFINSLNAAAPLDDIYVYQQPVGGWVSGHESLKLSYPTYGRGMLALATTDSVLVVSTYDKPSCTGLNCTPAVPTCGADNLCASAIIFDTNAISPSADVYPTLGLSTGEMGTPKDQTFTLPITITNYDATTESDDVQITGNVPPQLDNFMLTPTKGSCSVSAGQFNCDVGNISAGLSVTVAITAKAPNTITFLTENVQITSANDRIQSDNQPSFTYRVGDQPTAQSENLSGIGSVSSTFKGVDADGLPITFRIISQPAFGQVTVDAATGTEFTYTPFPGAPEFDSFVYVSNDGYMDSEPATVKTDVTNDKPSIGGNVNLVSNTGKGNLGLSTDLMLLFVFYVTRRRRVSAPGRH